MTETVEILTPDVIEDTPFPGYESTTAAQNSSDSTKTVLTPDKVTDNKFPVQRVAVEVLSSSLNTRSRRILDVFEFAKQGALQIGEYVNGVSGDLRLTPNGITARNTAGNTTFAIDGTTGDAIFAGTLQAGTVITGQVVVGDNSIILDGVTKQIIVNDGTEDIVVIDTDGILINSGKLVLKDDTDTTIIDPTGLVSSANFAFGSVTHSGSQTTNSSSFQDVSSMSLSFTLARAARVLFLATISGGADDGYNNSDVCEAIINLDGSQIGGTIYLPGVTYDTGGGRITKYMVGSGQVIASVSSGSHTVKLQYRSNNSGRSVDISSNNKFLGYVVLGK